MKTLSIIIPAYNEETHIVEMLDELLREDLNNPFSLVEVVVVDDGSEDCTRSVVEDYSLKDNRVRCEWYGENRGKGAAVAHGIKNTEGDYKIFLDADGSTHVDSITEILNNLHKEGADIVIGSRAKSSGGKIFVAQSKDRTKLGGFGKKMIKHVLKMPIEDTQCGCKVFKKEIADELFDDLKVKGWMFDCEVLYKAHKRGYETKELGVAWSDKDNSKVKLSSYPRSFIDLIRIKIFNM